LEESNVMNYKHAITITATGLLAFAVSTASADLSYTYLGEWNNHEYWVTDLELEYYDAREAAVQLGIDLGNSAYLASITSQDETDFIQSLSLDVMWIGLNDLDLDGQWSWDSGESFNYSDWSIGEPNGHVGDEPVAVMNWGDDYGWNDWKDLDRYAVALIEVAVPTPGVLGLLCIAGLAGPRRRRR
jgi:hypothetical protein